MNLFLKTLIVLLFMSIITSYKAQDVSYETETTIEFQTIDKDKVETPGGQSSNDD